MGFFQRLKTVPQAEREFNQALEVYRQLRAYPERSLQYRQQLRQVAASCRSAIALSERHGDAHVLLANMYFLMFIDGFPSAGDPLPLKLAAAVIQHWSDEPMRQYPWTKNRETAQTLYSQVTEARRASLPHGAPMEELKATYYIDAVSRDMFSPPQATVSSDVSSLDTPPTAPAYCPHCGAGLVEGARFCMACGRAVRP
jgi:hypothetical protein